MGWSYILIMIRSRQKRVPRWSSNMGCVEGCRSGALVIRVDCGPALFPTQAVFPGCYIHAKEFLMSTSHIPWLCSPPDWTDDRTNYCLHYPNDMRVATCDWCRSINNGSSNYWALASHIQIPFWRLLTDATFSGSDKFRHGRYRVLAWLHQRLTLLLRW